MGYIHSANESPPYVIYVNGAPYFITPSSNTNRSIKNMTVKKLGYVGESIDDAFSVYVKKYTPSQHRASSGSRAGVNPPSTSGDYTTVPIYVKHNTLFHDDKPLMKDIIGVLEKGERDALTKQYGAIDKEGYVYSYRKGNDSKTPIIQNPGKFKIESIGKPLKKSYYIHDTARLLETVDGKLYFFSPANFQEYDVKQAIELPGKFITAGSYTPTQQANICLGVVTSEGLFLFAKKHMLGKGEFIGSLSSKGLKETYKVGSVYKISLPENVKPEDIKSVQVIEDKNMYLLTRQGKAYSIGDNDHYQRGTKEKLDPSEWNEIKYPEKIKQIEVKNVCGLFALSESGDLYYHGYNENGFYPITKHKSDIDSPVKVMDNVQFIISGHVESLFAFDNEGIPYYIPCTLDNRVLYDKDLLPSLDKPVVHPTLFKNILPDLNPSSSVLYKFIDINC